MNLFHDRRQCAIRNGERLAGFGAELWIVTKLRKIPAGIFVENLISSFKIIE